MCVYTVQSNVASICTHSQKRGATCVGPYFRNHGIVDTEIIGLANKKTNLLLNMDYHVSDRQLTQSLLLRETATFNREEHSQGVANVWDHTYVTLKTLLLPSQTMQAY